MDLVGLGAFLRNRRAALLAPSAASRIQRLSHVPSWPGTAMLPSVLTGQRRRGGPARLVFIHQSIVAERAVRCQRSSGSGSLAGSCAEHTPPARTEGGPAGQPTASSRCSSIIPDVARGAGFGRRGSRTPAEPGPRSIHTVTGDRIGTTAPTSGRWSTTMPSGHPHAAKGGPSGSGPTATSPIRCSIARASSQGRPTTFGTTTSPLPAATGPADVRALTGLLPVLGAVAGAQP